MRGSRRGGVAASFGAAALLGAVAWFGSPPAVAAPRPGYVAIVIAGHGYGCVRWHSGITGDEVLNDVASVRYRQDGVIVQIDGAPASGTADDTHYWSYWRDTGSAWQYSNLGPSNVTPAAGSVEGWSYDDGQAQASPPPQSPAGLYRRLCGSRDVASPTPHHSSAKRSSPSSHGLGIAGRAAAHPSSSATHRRSTSPHPVPSSAPPSTSSASTSAAPAAVALALPSLPPPSHASRDGGGSWVPATVGGGLAALVGGAALVVGVRRKRAGPART